MCFFFPTVVGGVLHLHHNIHTILFGEMKIIHELTYDQNCMQQKINMLFRRMFVSGCQSPIVRIEILHNIFLCADLWFPYAYDFLCKISFYPYGRMQIALILFQNITGCNEYQDICRA